MSNAHGDKVYISGSVLLAIPETIDGRPGYRTMNSDGFVRWVSESELEAYYRELTDLEMDLIVRKTVI